jgi:hypothetical protein
MDKKYVILNSSEIVSIEFKHILETSKTTLRYSLDGNKIIVKFIGETPDFLIDSTLYSHKEIIEIINDPTNGWVEE